VTLEQGMAITEQEAWLQRESSIEVRVPAYIKEIVEQLVFLAREDKRVDKRSGVSQRLPISVLENVVSNAERRALKSREQVAVPRVLDIYFALPSITGKMELEYEGELKGGDAVARELIRVAVGKVYDKYFEGANVSQIVQWFDLGGSLKLDESQDAAAMVRTLGSIQGLMEKLKSLKLSANEPDAVRASAAEFVLEGLYAHRRISRNEEHEFGAGERKREGQREEGPPQQRPNVRRQYN
jgi:magnesium chelatase subunit I